MRKLLEESIFIMEIWQRIENFNTYEISNKGRVRKGDKLMKPYNRKGYLHVKLSANGRAKEYKIHRLVAINFIDNKEDLPFVNHKDENKQNNNVDNLEWCDSQYNNTYGTRSERQADSMKTGVVMLDKDNNFIKEFRSINEASEDIGTLASNISNVLKGRQKYTKGFIFKYKEDYETNH